MGGGLYPPTEVRASWPAPNHVSPQTRGNAIVIYTIIMTALGMVTLTIRLYSRIFMTRASGWDDLLATTSLAFAIALSVLIIYAHETLGLGWHIWDLPLAWAAENRKVTWITEWCYVLASGFIKISVMLFYKRLSAPFTKAFLLATHIGIAYNIFYILAFLLTLCLLCIPTESYWMQFSLQWVEEGRKFHCAKENVSLTMSGIFSTIGDFYATCLPLFLVHFLDLPSGQKRALYSLFALGFLVVGAGIVRTYYLWYILNGTYDVPYYLDIMWIFSVLELYLSIIAASAPALKPFLRRFLVEPVRKTYATNSHGDHSGSSRKINTTVRGYGGSPFKFQKDKMFNRSSASNTVKPHNGELPRDDVERQTVISNNAYEMNSRNVKHSIPDNSIVTTNSFDFKTENIRSKSSVTDIGDNGLAIGSPRTGQAFAQFAPHPAVSGVSISPREVVPWDATMTSPGMSPSGFSSREAIAAHRAQRSLSPTLNQSAGRLPPPVQSRISSGNKDWPLSEPDVQYSHRSRGNTTRNDKRQHERSASYKYSNSSHLESDSEEDNIFRDNESSTKHRV